MNNKNLNYHVEPKRQYQIETSQQIHISSRDVAEDARLNFELDKWFWMPYRKGFALRGMTVLFLLACFPSPTYAEQCTPTPDCKSLGYSYAVSGVSGWYLPESSHLSYIHDVIDAVQNGLKEAGGTPFADAHYWTLTYYKTHEDGTAAYDTVNPVRSQYSGWSWADSSQNARLVLSFQSETDI